MLQTPTKETKHRSRLQKQQQLSTIEVYWAYVCLSVSDIFLPGTSVGLSEKGVAATVSWFHCHNVPNKNGMTGVER